MLNDVNSHRNVGGRDDDTIIIINCIRRAAHFSHINSPARFGAFDMHVLYGVVCLFSGSDTDFHGFVTKSIQFMSHICNVIDSRVGYNNYICEWEAFSTWFLVLQNCNELHKTYIILSNGFIRDWESCLKGITNWKWSCCKLWTSNTECTVLNYCSTTTWFIHTLNVLCISLCHMHTHKYKHSHNPFCQHKTKLQLTALILVLHTHTHWISHISVKF